MFLGFLAAIYYGPRKMLKTRDWYENKLFHSKVRRFLHGSVTKVFHTQQGNIVYGLPQTVQEIAKGTKLSEARVRKSLVVLKGNKEAIEEGGDTWRTPHRPAI